MSLRALIAVAIVLIATWNEARGASLFTDGPLKDDAFRIVSLPVEKAYADVQNMSPEKRKELIRYFRNERNRDVVENRDEYGNSLLVLGDEETLKEYVSKHRFGTLQYLPDPHFLELIAPAMFVDDHERYAGNGFSLQPHSQLAVAAVANILRIMPEVPHHVKVWLDSFNNTVVTAGEVRQIFRDWWKANEEAWHRRDYMALKGGTDMSHRNYAKLTEAERARLVTGTADESSKVPLENEAKKSQSQHFPEVTSQKLGAESSANAWVWIGLFGAIILCLAVAGLVIVWSRKTGK